MFGWFKRLFGRKVVAIPVCTVAVRTQDEAPPLMVAAPEVVVERHPDEANLPTVPTTMPAKKKRRTAAPKKKTAQPPVKKKTRKKVDTH